MPLDGLNLSDNLLVFNFFKTRLKFKKMPKEHIFENRDIKLVKKVSSAQNYYDNSI